MEDLAEQLRLMGHQLQNAQVGLTDANAELLTVKSAKAEIEAQYAAAMGEIKKHKKALLGVGGKLAAVLENNPEMAQHLQPIIETAAMDEKARLAKERDALVARLAEIEKAIA